METIQVKGKLAGISFILIDLLEFYFFVYSFISVQAPPLCFFKTHH